MAEHHQKRGQSESQNNNHYEFFGPPGALILSIALPCLCYAFYFACNDSTGCLAPAIFDAFSTPGDQLRTELAWPGLDNLFSIEATAWTVAYYLLSLLLFALLPAKKSEGVELASEGKLKYRCNALLSALVTLGGLAIATAIYGATMPIWTYIWDHYAQILTANILIACSLATFVYARSFTIKKTERSPSLRELANGGQTDNLIYDWFVGRELNPRIDIPVIGEVDIKFFCEMRPGLLGWMIFNLAFVAHQYNTFGCVSDSMLLTVAFQALYVLDSLYLESAMLTTIDITTDGFGFMLACGDLIWLPTVYNLQPRYLAMHPVHLGTNGIVAVLAVQVVGYYIFRASNSEKNNFRTNPGDPSVTHLKYITTPQGSKLLISGWWGVSRHINYLGDWIMAVSWCLPTGFAGFVIEGRKDQVRAVPGLGMPITYFYVVYVAILLIHREMRDEEKCAKKYGNAWEKYKQVVKWRIVPYVY